MKTVRVYSDESGVSGVRYYAFGSFWIDEEAVKDLESEVKKIRHKYGYQNSQGIWIDFIGELKWSKVSNKYLSIYKEFIDILISFITSERARFCCLVLDTKEPNVAQQGNLFGFEIGYFKLYYQLYFQNCEVDSIYKIYPDSIPINPIRSFNLFNLQSALERALSNKFDPTRQREEKFIHNITPLNSKFCQPIQMVDIIIGALAYGQNQRADEPGASVAKIELTKYIDEKLVELGVLSGGPKTYTRVRSHKFNIWLFRPNKKDPTS